MMMQKFIGDGRPSHLSLHEYAIITAFFPKEPPITLREKLSKIPVMLSK
ncbi:Hypothetical protein ETEE_2353 [Edwardsiella anguillarum ET080813]|uniref:Uncharacterized protein n=1 Tax=Edwardsiella anguillarum ET080813 TaxID=667120 RepID=A0A076LJS1_9GAMM|nr:Hypothetical protein ETEE_2353 [Edwardsiella anguillarum ET080813]